MRPMVSIRYGKRIRQSAFRSGLRGSQALLAACMSLCIGCAALAKAPPDWNKLLSKGYQLLSLAKNKEAAAEFQKVLDKYPDSPQAHLALGRALKKFGQISEAKAEFKRASELDPNLAEAWYEHGCLLEYDKQYAPAAEAFQRFLTLKPDAAERRNVEDRIRFCQQSQK